MFLVSFGWSVHPAVAAGGLVVQVVKTSDANGDGIFTKGEYPFGPSGRLIPRQAVITNPTSEGYFITGLFDESPKGSGIVTAHCSHLVGTVLGAGQSVTCLFFTPLAPGPQSNVFTAHVARARTVVIAGGGGGIPCTDPDPVKCPPPCPVPPLPLELLLGCVSALDDDTGQGSDEDEGGFFEDIFVSGMLQIAVDKTNNADGIAGFNDFETAPAEGAPVVFRIVIRNDGNTPAVLQTITDAFPGTAPFPICPQLATTVLGTGQSITCTFTLPAYSPAPGSLKVNTVVVRAACEFGVMCLPDSAEASDTSAVGTAAPPPTTVDVGMAKTNDADADQSFTESEIAPAAGAAVMFRAVIRNDGSAPVTITSLTDEYPGVSPAGVCADLIGTTLIPGQSVTCTFTLSGYAPAPGDLRVNTVRVTVREVCPTATPSCTPRVDEATDTSVVGTAAPRPTTVDVGIAKTNDADVDQSFTESEIAAGEGAAVMFRAVIRNDGSAPVTITSLTDEYPGVSPAGVCADLIGTTLIPGQSVTCTFTLSGYAPAPGDLRVNTVHVTVREECPAAEPGCTPRVDDASDTSVVGTAARPPGEVPTTPSPPSSARPLALTGVRIGGLVFGAGLCLFLGAANLRIGRRRSG